MPTKLISQFRLLNTSPFTIFPSMKFGVPTQTSRSLPIFTRIFPFKLKYLALQSHPVRNERVGVRRFSSRSFPERKTAGRRSEFTRVNREDGASKSLIEDEAELSDWVGELRTDSHRGRLTSDEDDSDGERGRNGRRGGGPFSMKKRRENGADRFGESTWRRTRDPVEKFSRNPRKVRGFDYELDRDEEEDEFQSRGRNRVSRGENPKSALGKRSGEELRRRGKDSRRKSQFLSEDDDTDDNEEVSGKFVGGFKDLLSEDDSDEITEDDDDEELLKKSRSSLFGKESSSPSPRASPGRSDSYLSETRCVQRYYYCM